ncbi:MAG: 2TM domain-containing protein [Pseudomonadota bacterium]
MGIQEQRLDHGWSQEELAELSGVSVRTIQRVEGGRPASLETLKSLAAAFETKVSDLVQEPAMTPSSVDAQFAEHQEREAIAYVQNLKGFHLHWISFVLILPCLLAFNLLVTPEEIWIHWVAIPWTLALGLHAIMLFSLYGLFGAQWEQREFQKRLQAGKKV